MNTIILDNIKIERILKRIAFQILEHCHAHEELTLVGIKPRGTWVSKQLEKHLKELSDFRITRLDVDIDHLEELEALKKSLKGHQVVLIDDVLKSGRTMMNAAAAIVAFEPRHLFTACLVDRKHRKFPIKSDFTGLSLATTLQEHIRLEIKPKPTIFLE